VEVMILKDLQTRTVYKKVNGPGRKIWEELEGLPAGGHKVAQGTKQRYQSKTKV
jgi:hypothetical protein